MPSLEAVSDQDSVSKEPTKTATVRVNRRRRLGVSRYVVPHASYRWFLLSSLAGTAIGGAFLTHGIWRFHATLLSDLELSTVAQEYMQYISLYASDLLGMSTTALVVFVLYVFALNAFLFHRVAGPMYRITNHLKALLESGDVRPLTLRQGDRFSEVAELLNLVLEKTARERDELESTDS